MTDLIAITLLVIWATVVIAVGLPVLLTVIINTAVEKMAKQAIFSSEARIYREHGSTFVYSQITCRPLRLDDVASARLRSKVPIRVTDR